MRKNKSILVAGVFMLLLVLIIIVSAIIVAFNKKEISDDNVVQYMSEVMTEVSESEEIFDVTFSSVEDIFIESSVEFESEYDFQSTEQIAEVNPNEVGYNVALNHRDEVEEWLSLLGAKPVDFDEPYSLSGNVVIFETEISGDIVLVQVITEGNTITNISVLQEMDEQVPWLPVGDTDRSDDLIIVDVGNKRFDITYGEHAELFEVVVNKFNLSDPLGGSTYIEMLDCDKENTIEVLITNSQCTFYVQDIGDYYKTWVNDELNSIFLEKAYPYIETSPF